MRVAAGLAAVAGLSLLAGCGSSPGIVSYGTISTFAGTNTAGNAGDGGPAAKAQLNTPACVAVDAGGNVYVVDAGANVVRKITSAGVISTYAGTGTAGYNGDGGPAAAATLQDPNGCALDAAGDLLIADTGNNVIRKVDAGTGTITTVAGTGYGAGTTGGGFAGDGGAAGAAELNHPYGVTLDAAGDLYIADTLNYRVREVAAGSGVITTIAGDGSFDITDPGTAGPATSAELYNPEGLAVDAAGDVYISEQATSRVRKVDTSGNITVVAGTGQYGFNGNGGGPLVAQLNAPSGLALDSAGNLYIADVGNQLIRRVLSGGKTMQTVAGTDIAGYKGDGGAATDAELNNPQGIAFDASGDMFIADTSNAVVREVKPK